MNLIIHSVFFLIVLGLLGFVLLLLTLLIDSAMRGHDLPTSRRATKGIIKIISERKAVRNFYDLGCAHGALAIRIKKNFPALSVYAIDNNPLRIFFAKMKAFLSGCQIVFWRKNIFEVDLSNAGIVYAYLWYDLMPPLEKKLQKELKSGAMVITNTSNFPNWKPIQKIITYPKVPQTPDFETLFVYQKD